MSDDQTKQQNKLSDDELLWVEPKNDHSKVNNQFLSTAEPKLKSKSQKTFLNSVNNFFRTIGVLTVLAVLIISSVLAFILLRPQSDFSKWAINSSFLQKYLTIKDDSNGSSVTIKQEEAKNFTDFLGLNTNYSSFQFAKPGDAKTTTEVVQAVLPSVLSISVREDSSRLGVTSLVSGTGFIVSEDGLVVTNKHVISEKCTDTTNSIKISGLAHDQKAYEMNLVAVDPVDDIAILKIQNMANTKFTPVKFGDGSSVPLGAEVIAVGNVLGQLQNTVTKGIISGSNRTVETTKANAIDDECTSTKVTFIDNLIQTDAAINKGNSGGPLFDSTGLLIGMNTLGTTDSQNIGFAISSSLILSDLNNYAKTGKIVRPRLGIYSRPITPLQKQENDWLPEDYGEILLNPSEVEAAVSKGSPAESVGLQAGDIILEFNGTKLVATDLNPSPLRRMILSKQPDDEVDLVVRKAISGDSVNGYKYESQSKTIKVKLGSVDFPIGK